MAFSNLRWNYSPLKEKAVRCRTVFSFLPVAALQPLESLTRATVLLRLARRSASRLVVDAEKCGSLFPIAAMTRDSGADGDRYRSHFGVCTVWAGTTGFGCKHFASKISDLSSAAPFFADS